MQIVLGGRAGVAARRRPLPQGRDSERIHLVATHVNLDCVHNYPEESVTWNANTDVKGVRQNNGAHPAKSGYDQIGDAVYAWLKGNVK